MSSLGLIGLNWKRVAELATFQIFRDSLLFKGLHKVVILLVIGLIIAVLQFLKELVAQPSSMLSLYSASCTQLLEETQLNMEMTQVLSSRWIDCCKLVLEQSTWLSQISPGLSYSKSSSSLGPIDT